MIRASTLLAMSISLTINQASQTARHDASLSEIRVGVDALRWPIEDLVEDPATLSAHVRRRIAALSTLSNLDSDETAPSDAAVRSCVTLIGGIAGRGPAPLPRVSTMGDGDLMLEWRHGSKRILLFVLPSGTTRLQQLTGEGMSTQATEVARNPLPSQLAEALTWLLQ